MWNADVQSTGLILNRVSTILADTILIVVTWKFLPASVIATCDALTESWTLKGLASVMLCNGMFTSGFDRGFC